MPTIIAIIAAAYSIQLAVLPATYLGDDWPTRAHDGARTGRTAVVGPSTGTIAWNILADPTLNFTQLESNPVIADDGLLYVGRDDGLTCVDTRTRSVLWFSEPLIGLSSVPGAPAIADGYVVWGDLNGFDDRFLCADRFTGEVVWSVPDVFAVSPHIDGDRVYFLDVLGFAWCVDLHTGNEIWKTDLGGAVFGRLSVDSTDGIIVPYGPLGDQLAALDPVNGEVRWTHESILEIVGVSPSDGGRIYTGNWHLEAVDANSGEELISEWLGGSIRGSIAIGHDGTVYAGLVDGPKDLVAFSPISGRELWRFSMQGWMFNAPVIDGNGTIFLTSTDFVPERGWVQAVRADGTELWTVEMPRSVAGSPTIGPDGTLFVLCRDKNLYAFRDGPNPSVTFTGACPGVATLDVVGASPNESIAVVFASGRGETTIPVGLFCEGTTLHLNATARVVSVGATDSNGDLSMNGTIPASACGGYLQVLDLTSCHVSNLVQIH